MVVFCLVWLGFCSGKVKLGLVPGLLMSKTVCYTIVYILLIFTVYCICSIRRRSCDILGGLRLGFPAS